MVLDSKKQLAGAPWKCLAKCSYWQLGDLGTRPSFAACEPEQVTWAQFFVF